jgi:hypothetical protein
MSTRCTISYNDDYHLYQECFENDNVYLRLDSGDWSASLETESIDWRDGDYKRPQLAIRMNVTMWRKIVEGWIASQWAQDPSRDHKKYEIDLEAISDWVNKMKKIKEAEEKDDVKE